MKTLQEIEEELEKIANELSLCIFFKRSSMRCQSRYLAGELTEDQLEERLGTYRYYQDLLSGSLQEAVKVAIVIKFQMEPNQEQLILFVKHHCRNSANALVHGVSHEQISSYFDTELAQRIIACHCALVSFVEVIGQQSEGEGK
jgi:hypothetical protein